MIHGRWETFRAVLFLAGLALVGYVAYRYTLFSPPDHGSLYGKIFPLALPFAALAMALALRPGLIARVPGQGGLALRAALKAFGGVWMGAEQAEPRAVREPVWGAAAPLS